jgi:hypothetical protein
MLQPVVRRTWAPRGQTPLLRQWDRRDRLSAISALTVAPRRRRYGLYWALHRHNIRSADVLRFLRALRRHLPHGFTLIWDRSQPHRAATVRDWLAARAPPDRRGVAPGLCPRLQPGRARLGPHQVWGPGQLRPGGSRPSRRGAGHLIHRHARRARSPCCVLPGGWCPDLMCIIIYARLNSYIEKRQGLRDQPIIVRSQKSCLSLPHDPAKFPSPEIMSRPAHGGEAIHRLPDLHHNPPIGR